MSRHVTRMTIEDAEHYTEDQRAEIIASYPAHERDARTKGIPQLGSGRVFPIAEDAIRCAAFEIPEYWPQIGGLDFGWDHPFAAVSIAWDRDADTIYVTRCYRQREATPTIHVAALKPWGAWLPWAWPHDGLQHEKSSGEALAIQYKTAGLNMLPERSHYLSADGKKISGVEPGVADMNTRMEAGTFKVFDHLSEWFEEFRLYHRKDGRIVKLRDDLLSATRYALMMLRFAEVRPRRHAAPADMPMRGPSGWMGL